MITPAPFRLQLDIGPDLKGRLDRLTETHDLTKADTVRKALDLLDAATDPERGIFHIDEHGVKRQIVVL